MTKHLTFKSTNQSSTSTKILFLVANAHRHTELVLLKTIQTVIRNGAPAFAIRQIHSENRNRKSLSPKIKHDWDSYAEVIPEKSPQQLAWENKTSFTLIIKTNAKSHHKTRRAILPQGQTLSSSRSNLIKLFHETDNAPQSGNFAATESPKLLWFKYYCHKMKDSGEKCNTTCDVCQKSKSANKERCALLQSSEPPSKMWTNIPMNFITFSPLSTKKTYKYFKIVDWLSQIIRIVQYWRGPNAPQIARVFIKTVFCRNRLPPIILLKRISVSLGNVWKCLLKLLKTEVTPSSAYHPRADCQTKI